MNIFHDEDRLRDRQAPNAGASSSGNDLYFRRRQSSLSQAEGSEIFEDARESWESEPSPVLGTTSSQDNANERISQTRAA